jgi:hypothetical protein
VGKANSHVKTQRKKMVDMSTRAVTEIICLAFFICVS